jgi:AraC family transcriptional activator FtrA
VNAFEVAASWEILGCPRLDATWRYQVIVCGELAGRVQTESPWSLQMSHGLEALRTARVIVVPGTDRYDPPVSETTLTELRRAHARGARIVAISTGSFVLGKAGLLDGRRATTHWRHLAELAVRHPRASVQPDALFVEDDGVITSAGMAAAIDVLLEAVRRDLGAEAAARVARETVAAPRRTGNQPQLVERPVPLGGEAGLADVRAWMLHRLAEPMTIDTLARRAFMSRRQFTRVFRAETGTSPWQWLLDQRLQEACRLLETSVEPVERVSSMCGFATPAAFRHHFKREHGMTPTGYRLSRRPTGRMAG